MLKKLLAVLLTLVLLLSLMCCCASALEKGDQGSEVKKLQKRLVKLGYYKITKISGVYSEDEVKAVKAFQTANGLEPTGIADDETLDLLYNNMTKRASNDILYIDEYDVEIHFRDDEWGTSYSVLEEKYKKWGGGVMFENTTERAEEIITGEDSGPDFEYSGLGKARLYTSLESLESVAGYSVYSVELYFSYLPVEGILQKNDSNTALYAAQYTFEPQNADLMMSDLTAKLTSLYGDVDDSGKVNGFMYDYDWLIWNGLNNTAVALTKKTSLYSDPEEITILITYTTFDGDLWLQAASDAEKERIRREEEAASSSGDTSGL